MNNNHDVIQQQLYRYANREEGMVKSYTNNDVEQTDLNSTASITSATLPSCKTLMQQQSEYASGEFLTSTPVNCIADIRMYLIHIGKAGGVTLMENAVGAKVLDRPGDIKCRMDKVSN